MYKIIKLIIDKFLTQKLTLEYTCINAYYVIYDIVSIVPLLN